MGSFADSACAIWSLEKGCSVVDEGSGEAAVDVRAAFSAASMDRGLDFVLSKDCEFGRLCHDNGAVLIPGEGTVPEDVTLVRLDSMSKVDSFSFVGEVEKLVTGLSMLSKVSSPRNLALSRTGEDVRLRRSETREARWEGGGGVFAGDDF